MLATEVNFLFTNQYLFTQLKILIMKRLADLNRFFNNDKSNPKNGSGINQSRKRHGRVVWESRKYGTYRFSVHGELK